MARPSLTEPRRFAKALAGEDFVRKIGSSDYRFRFNPD
jgi:hypothetical protein